MCMGNKKMSYFGKALIKGIQAATLIRIYLHD